MKKFTHFKFHIPYSGRKGTTLVELMLVIAVIAALSFISFLSLLGRKGDTDLKNTTEQMASLLREARSRSVSQASSTSWGVHFDNAATSSPFFAIFYSVTYSTSTTIGYYKLPSTLVYATSTIPSGSYKEVTFSQISGLASASTSITIFLPRSVPLGSSTINVGSSGAVSF